MTLYIFNPENDMALADGKPGYTPPAQIQQMRRELWWLPEWWAEEGDIVWNGEDPLSLHDDTKIMPWGWSPALCHQLKQAGVQASLLPSAEKLEHIRQLSHRQTAVKLLAELREQLPLDGHICGESTLCHSKEEAEDAVARYGEAMLKLPWSSSGRGIRKISTEDATSLRGRWKGWGRIQRAFPLLHQRAGRLLGQLGGTRRTEARLAGTVHSLAVPAGDTSLVGRAAEGFRLRGARRHRHDAGPGRHLSLHRGQLAMDDGPRLLPRCRAGSLRTNGGGVHLRTLFCRSRSL